MPVGTFAPGTRLEAVPHHRRWATFIVALYTLLLAVLTGPVMWALFLGESTLTWKTTLAFEFVGMPWPYWLILAALTAAQLGLLIARIDTLSQRPGGRRGLVLPVSAGLLGSTLLGGVFLATIEFLKGERTPEWTGWTAVAIALGSWGFWTWVFRRVTRNSDGGDIVARVCGRLLRGSVLELLIAVPTHIVARRRGYCCAGVYTGASIGLGVAVMLASFGPAVFVLFADRWRRLHPRVTSVPPGRGREVHT